VENAGNLVRIIGEAGSARVFTRDTRNGGYFSGKGDSSTLATVAAGVYQLRDPNGIITRFRADGRIDFVEDPNANRVTAAYDGAGRLTRLAHTSGGFISIAYDGAGFVQTVTNSVGQSMTYGYDAGGSYLQTVTTDDGKVTSYTYESGGVLAQRHALTSMTRNGTTRHFTFDTRGRIASTYLGGSEALFTLGYDNTGGVTVTDALGTTRLFFDQRGLLSKVTDALGNVTSAQYNNNLRLTERKRQ